MPRAGRDDLILPGLAQAPGIANRSRDRVGVGVLVSDHIGQVRVPGIVSLARC